MAGSRMRSRAGFRFREERGPVFCRCFGDAEVDRSARERRPGHNRIVFSLYLSMTAASRAAPNPEFPRLSGRFRDDPIVPAPAIVRSAARRACDFAENLETTPCTGTRSPGVAIVPRRLFKKTQGRPHEPEPRPPRGARGRACRFAENLWTTS